MSKILVAGAGGFIGHHLVAHLRDLGHEVYGADLKTPEFTSCRTSKFYRTDLRYPENCRKVCEGMDQIYHLAADVGGIGYLSKHECNVMRNNLLIDLHMLEAASLHKCRFLFASSACVYPEYRQDHPFAASLAESEVYPAQPDGSYGWAKLTTERLCEQYRIENGLETRIARFQNVYGPEEAWQGGREKAPTALARKVALAKIRGEREIEVWGDGQQRRCFIYVSDVVKALVALMNSSYSGAVNIGTDFSTSVDELCQLIMMAAKYPVHLNHTSKFQGVRGRNSDNKLAHKVLPEWKPEISIEQGMKKTYDWVASQVAVATPDRKIYEAVTA